MKHTTTRTHTVNSQSNQRAEPLSAAELEAITGGDGSLTGKPATVAIVRPLSPIFM
jgi:hypothetical protein